MKKKEIIEKYFSFIELYEIQNSNAIIAGGAACVLHGARAEATDLDICVPNTIMDQFVLRENTFHRYINEYGGTTIKSCAIKLKNGIEIFSTDLFLCYKNFYSELGVVSLCTPASIIEHKLYFGRKKDETDICNLLKLL